jgi:cell fate (sporulation/competence/biofilm development) regulator YlbF (YheA/YmcA/DUF963 family)
MNEEEKREFEQFKIMQEKLTRAFVEGYNHPDAQELGVYVAQAIRDVAKLLKLLDDYENHSTDEILDAIHAVVSNHFSITEANRLLTSVRD